MRRRQVAVKDVLKSVLPEGARERIYSAELIGTRWSAVVGAELARRSEPESLNGGVLTVRVTDPVWGKTIHRLQHEIVPELNRALGSSLVRRINFTKRDRLRGVAAVPADPRPEPVPEPPAAVADAASAIEEPELRSLVLRSAARYLRAQRGKSSKSLRRK